jgi:hypothetical protein
VRVIASDIFYSLIDYSLVSPRSRARRRWLRALQRPAAPCQARQPRRSHRPPHPLAFRRPRPRLTGPPGHPHA